MAKKKLSLTTDTSSLPSVFDMVKKIDETAEIISESAYSNIKEWVSSGNYILNACMSGDLFKALPSGRVTTLYGPSNTGKTFLACSCAREAQKAGYTVIYMDSEGAVDAKFVTRLGVDASKLIIKQVSTIAETSQFIANICKGLQEQEDTYGTHQKVMFVLDSLGNLTSDKEREDMLAGSGKRDMTKSQELKALFRVNATPIARLGCVFLVNNHSYAQIGAYVPTQVMAGGCVLPDEEIITLEKGNIAIKNVESGIHVLGYDGLWHPIEKVWNHKKPTYTLTFDDGSTFNCSDTHRLLINKDEPENENSWKTVAELNEGDIIYRIDI